MSKPNAPQPPLALALLAWLGLAAAAYLALAWCFDWPGAWGLHRRLDPPAERRARAVAAHAAERLHEFAGEGERAGAIVFLGSSTIERMPLAELFPSRPCLDRGIASAEIPLLVALLPRLVPRETCAGFVVYAGSIDWRDGGASAGEVVRRLATLLDALERVQPRAPVALLGLLPDRDGGGADELVLVALERGMAELVHAASRAERPVAFVRTARAPLVSTDGSLSVEHSADDLHLDAAGYRVLARWLLEDGGEVARKLAP